MADVKISELTAGTAAADSVVAASDAGATATTKVTLQGIARLFSDATGITGASSITNVVAISQANYDSLGGSVDASTLYVITG